MTGNWVLPAKVIIDKRKQPEIVYTNTNQKP
jgi:hypothetical protein